MQLPVVLTKCCIGNIHRRSSLHQLRGENERQILEGRNPSFPINLWIPKAWVNPCFPKQFPRKHRAKDKPPRGISFQPVRIPPHPNKIHWYIWVLYIFIQFVSWLLVPMPRKPSSMAPHLFNCLFKILSPTLRFPSVPRNSCGTFSARL